MFSNRRLLSLNIFSLFVVVVCLRLSYWQLGRAHEKEALLAQKAFNEHNILKLSEVNLDHINANQYRRVKIRGKFLQEHAIFIDNQMVNHRFGYDILMPFLSDAGESIWTNRGWLQGSLDRQILPQIPSVDGTVEIEGMLIAPSKKSFILGKIEDENIPSRFQTMNLEALRKVYPTSVANLLLILSTNVPGSLTYHYNIVVVPPARHRGYAVQWLCIAIVWLGLVLYANFKTDTNRI